MLGIKTTAEPVTRLRKGAETRVAILEQGWKLAARDGLQAISIGDLALELGLSKSGLFAHFGSKESLQVAIMDHVTARFVSDVVRPALSAPRGVPRLRALFDTYLGWALSHGRAGCLFMSASFEFDDRPGPVRERLVANQRDWLEMLAQAVRIAVTEKHFRADTDPELAAQEIYGIQMATHHVYRLLRDTEAIPRARRAFERWLSSNTPT